MFHYLKIINTKQVTNNISSSSINKDGNYMIDGKSFFDESVKNGIRTYYNIWKIATGQGDDNTAGCLLDYAYFKDYYKMIAVD